MKKNIIAALLLVLILSISGCGSLNAKSGEPATEDQSTLEDDFSDSDHVEEFTVELEEDEAVEIN